MRVNFTVGSRFCGRLLGLRLGQCNNCSTGWRDGCLRLNAARHPLLFLLGLGDGTKECIVIVPNVGKTGLDATQGTKELVAVLLEPALILLQFLEFDIQSVLFRDLVWRTVF